MIINSLKKAFISFLSLTLIIVLSSCNDDTLDENQIDTYTQSVKIVEGVIEFKDLATFQTQMESFQEMNHDNRINWLQNIGFNNSLYFSTAGLSLEEVEENGYLDIPDPALAMILNSEGVYAIGNKLHKITAEAELIMDKESLSISKVKWANNPKVEKIPVYYGPGDYHLEKKNKNARDETKKFEPYNGDFFTSPSQTRRSTLGVRHLSAHLIGWNRSYFSYASVGVKLRGRKKRSGKWGNDAMWFARIDYAGNATFTTDNGATTTWYEEDGKEGRHEVDVQETMFTRLGIGVRFDEANIIVDITYEDDGYPRVYLNNQILNL